MILSEKEMTRHTIEKSIGSTVHVDWRRLEPKGSASFFLKSFVNKEDPMNVLREDSKCNFEKFSDGILLRSNYANTVQGIPILSRDIESILLIKGNEEINPFLLSPMWMLLKLGVPISIARYFKSYASEYFIGEMKLLVETKQYAMEFIQNGYIFERQAFFFRSLGYGEKCSVIL